jgi:DNA polymerase-3 subunit gamma/tau
LSQEKGKKTIYEKKNELKKKLFEDAKKTEIYKRVKELFPEAELTDVKELNQKEE